MVTLVFTVEREELLADSTELSRHWNHCLLWRASCMRRDHSLAARRAAETGWGTQDMSQQCEVILRHDKSNLVIKMPLITITPFNTDNNMIRNQSPDVPCIV